MAVSYPPAFERDRVAGLKVVSDVVYESPLTAATGRFIPIHGVRTLTLEDGSTVYGCRDCEFTGAGPGKVRAHRNAEHHFAEDGAGPKPAKRDGGVGQLRQPGPDALSMTLHELLQQAGEIETYALAMGALDDENRTLHKQIVEEKQVHREEVAEIRRGHREELAEARRLQKSAERDLAAMRKRLGKLIGGDN